MRRVARGAHIAKKVACVALSCVLATSLVGCKDSSKLTEIIYDQESEIIDYDNPTKMLVQDVDAEETSDQLPLVETTEEYPDEETQDEPTEGEDEEQQEAPEEDLSQQANEGYSTNDAGTTVVTGGSGTGSQSDEGSGDNEDGDSDSGGGDVEDPDNSDGDTGKNNDTGGTSGARGGGTETYYNATGTYEEPPTGVDYVAAVGEAATIVSMLAGDAGALLYTDAEWASRSHEATGLTIQNVLGSKYNDDVVIAWSEDGDSYDLSDEMLATMIADERLEAVFVTSGENTLTESQQQQLEDAGIVVSVLPALTSASNILNAVSWVGEIFAAGHNANYDAQALAEEYVSFHDGIVSDAAELAGTTASDTGSEVLNSKDGNMYTLYVSDWVDGISYVGTSKVSGGLDTSHGIGICELGYRWSPLAYYLSVGGAINTASQSTETSGTSLVWQFNTNHITALESDFSLRGLVSSYQTASGNTGYNKTYLMSGDEDGVGTSNFPAVIVANQHIAEQMTGDKSSESNSLYKIYEVQQVTKASGGTITYVGPSVANSDYAPLFAVAGLVAKQNTVQNYSDILANWDGMDYSVVVNPHGLFESWTEGTVESVLETAWISCLYRNGENPSQVIYDFYATFYGYSLNTEELQAILDGELS